MGWLAKTSMPDYLTLSVLKKRLVSVEFCSSQMSLKDFSSQSPSQLRWTLPKSCGSDNLHAKGSWAWTWALLRFSPSMAQWPWTKWVPLWVGGGGGLMVFNCKIQRLSWWTVVGMLGMFVHPFVRVHWTPTMCLAQVCHRGLIDEQNQTRGFAPWGLVLIGKRSFLIK